MSEAELILPGAEDRTVIIGTTGDGKTILAGWLLSKQRFDKRAWVWLDFKEEIFLDQIGTPPLRKLTLNQMPGKRGLYRLRIRPGDDKALEEWLWKIWERGNVGLVCDELSLLPQKDAWKAILRQGRSKFIPVIGCTQRPVDCDRENFSEAQYRVLFGIGDERDLPTIKGLFGGLDVRRAYSLPRYWCFWYDRKRKELLTLRQVPKPSIVAADLRSVAPRALLFGG